MPWGQIPSKRTDLLKRQCPEQVSSAGTDCNFRAVLSHNLYTSSILSSVGVIYPFWPISGSEPRWLPAVQILALEFRCSLTYNAVRPIVRWKHRKLKMYLIYLTYRASQLHPAHLRHPQNTHINIHSGITISLPLPRVTGGSISPGKDPNSK